MEKLDIWIIIGALVLCAVLLAVSFGSQVIPTGSWGLSFVQPGQAPAGPVSQAQLAEFDAWYVCPQSQNVLYLTFDAGYENGCTAKILDVLAEHDVQAAFFLTGHYIRENADLVRRMAAEGHTVGNHTMHHPDMSALTGSAFAAELEELAALYEETVGSPMAKLYRPPQGVYAQENLEQAQSMGYRTVFWSLAYADWDNANQPTQAFAMEKLTGRLHNGAIVLLHSTSETNAAILDRLLDTWQQQGYRFAPLSELG